MGKGSEWGHSGTLALLSGQEVLGGREGGKKTAGLGAKLSLGKCLKNREECAYVGGGGGAECIAELMQQGSKNLESETSSSQPDASLGIQFR